MWAYITKGLFRGYTAALVRDVPSGAAYFTVLELSRRHLPGYDDSAVLMPFISGCFTGMVTWTIAMPGDCLKSIIQTEFALAKSVDTLPSSSLITNYRQILSENGGSIFRLYRGYQWVMMRAVVTSGAGICGLENLVRFIDDNWTGQNQNREYGR